MPPLEALRRVWLARADEVTGHELVAPVLGVARGAHGAPAPEHRDVAARGSRTGTLATAVDEHRFAAALYDRSRAGAARRDAIAAWASSIARGTRVAAAEACVDSLAEWGDRVGVSEERRPVSTVSARRYHVAALGPRPADPAGLETWRSAAAVLDRYHRHWSLDDPQVLRWQGESSAMLSTMPARQLTEHLGVRRTIDEARRRLGRDSPHVDRAAARVVEPIAFGPD